MIQILYMSLVASLAAINAAVIGAVVAIFLF